MEQTQVHIPFIKIVLGPMTNPTLALEARIVHDLLPACTITLSVVVLANFIKMYACELKYETGVRFTFWGNELEVTEWLESELCSSDVTIDLDFSEDTL